MIRTLRNRPLSQRLLSGVGAGLIVGLLLGTVIAIRIIQVNESLHTPYMQGQLKLHLAAIYSLLMLIPGLIVGLLVLGRQQKIGLVAHGIVVLLALVAFYYGRNRLSIHLFSHTSNLRWLVEILGAVGWAAVCWFCYRIGIFLEKRFRGWITRIILIVTVILLVMSVVQVVKPSPVSAKASEPPVLPEPIENVKVAVIGIDGAWWDIIDPLMEAGRMPAFQSMVDRGVRAHCQTLLPTFSPRIWTTIATGKVPEKHQITSFRVCTFPITGVVLPLTKIPASFWEFNQMLGTVIRMTPINSTFRMSEAIWNILSDAGVFVGVMNWWASYPAEPVLGYTVSDHALYNKALKIVMGEDIAGDPRSVFPPHLLPELEVLVIDPMRIPVDSVARFIHFETVQDRDWYLNTKDYRVFDEDSEAAMFKFSYPEDVTMVRAALHLLKTKGQPDFFAVYLDGLDSMEHLYLPYHFHEQHHEMLKPENIARLKDVVKEYYVYVDEILGQFLKVLDPSTIVIVVSDHGFDHKLYPGGIYNHLNAPPGVLLIAGNGIKQGETITNASVKDITPTILTMFGLPVGRDMDGRVLTEIFNTEDVPVTWVNTYDTDVREPGRGAPSQIDKAINERLRALGYVR